MQIRAAWLENCTKSDRDFYEDFIQMLVKTLDAYARCDLAGVEQEEQIPEYIGRLKSLGNGWCEEAKGKLAGLDHPDKAAEVRSRIIEGFKVEARTVWLSAEPNSEIRSLTEEALAAGAAHLGEVRYQREAEVWRQGRNKLIFKLETWFEALYHRWGAEALRKVAVPVEEPLRSATSWEELELTFISDHRVVIQHGQTRSDSNYAEMGFADARSDNPSQLWHLLGHLATGKGVLKDPASKGHVWLNVHMQMARLRKRLRERFEIEGDPIPYFKREGYRTRFRIARSPAAKF